MPGLLIYRIILDIWQGFKYAAGIRCSYNNIIIIAVTVIISELLLARFVRPGSPQLTILPFFNTS